MSRLVAVLALALAAVLMCTGCLSRMYQRSAVADWQAFSDRVTQSYRVKPVTVVAGRPAIQYARASSNADARTVTVSPEIVQPAPNGGTWDLLIAHELAHVILGHRGQVPQQELDADAEAVKILMIGRGWTGQRAFRIAHESLWNAMVQANGRPRAGGHGSWCSEINDLVGRYPAYAGQVKT
jgi:hypothetical protein